MNSHKTKFNIVVVLLFISTSLYFHDFSSNQSQVVQNDRIDSKIWDFSKVFSTIQNLRYNSRQLISGQKQYPILASAPLPPKELYSTFVSLDVIEMDDERFYFMVQDRWDLFDTISGMKGFRFEDEMTTKLHTRSRDFVSDYFSQRNSNAPEYPVISTALSCYRTVEASYQTMDFLSAEYPTLTEVIDIGPSYLKSVGEGGHEMKVLKLTNEESMVESKAPMFILCGIHPREMVPTETCARFAEDMLDEYGKDADKTWILDYTEIHIIMQSNPDGRENEEINSHFRRKNMHVCAKRFGRTCASKTNNGVDLNRNFPHSRWGTESSRLPCRSTYHGRSAASEKETEAIVNYLESVWPPGTNQVNAESGAYESDSKGVLMDLHSYGRDFFWPWAYADDAVAPNKVELTALGKKMASQTNPRYSSDNVVYNTSGDTTDYAYEAIGVAAYTVEIGSAFYEDCFTFERIEFRNAEKYLLYAARVSNAPYLLPKGPELALSLSTSITKNDKLLQISVHASDSLYAMEYSTGQQTIESINLYIDVHPYDSNAIPNIQVEEGLTSREETIVMTLPLSDLSPGKHSLFLQAHDTEGPGPVYSKFIEII